MEQMMIVAGFFMFLSFMFASFSAYLIVFGMYRFVKRVVKEQEEKLQNESELSTMPHNDYREVVKSKKVG